MKICVTINTRLSFHTFHMNRNEVNLLADSDHMCRQCG